VQGTLDAGLWMLTAVLLISSLLNVAYLVSIPVRGFFVAPPTPSEGLREAPLPSLIAIAITTAGCVALFLWADPLYQLVSEVVR